MSSGASDRVGDGDETGLREKYLHSQGAALYDEGRFDQAIDFFERAIALDDQPYTHYHLCLTYIEKKDFDKALREINRAIKLNPSIAKYYHRRSQIWQSRGDLTRAGEDYRKAVSLDANYARIERIRSSYGTIEQACSNVEMLEWCSTARTKSVEINNILRDFEGSLRMVREAVETASCALPCPAYCCHFGGETIRHGVHIGAWKLSAIRNFLKEKGLSESDFLGRIRFTGEEHLVRLIPPHHVVKERDQHVVYFPKRRKGGLDRALLKDLPKGKNYQELLWINEESRACAFLHEDRCMIHDLGEEPSLPACKEFLCMTGFVFALLKHLGMIEEAQLRTRSMAQFNHLAVEALLILGRTLYDEHLTGLRTARDEALKAAAEADTGDASDEVDRYLTKYRQLAQEYDNLFAIRSEAAKQEIQDRLGVIQERAKTKVEEKTRTKVEIKDG